MQDSAWLPIPKTSFNGGKHPERLTTDQFRNAVWKRDGGRSRCSGLLVFRGGLKLPMHTRGEVCHLKGRRVMPEWITDPDHAILLSGHEHALSDARGERLLWILDPETRENATDATKPILFVMRTRTGLILWEKIG